MRIRASALGQLMTGKIGLTDKQQAYLTKLMTRQNDPTAKALTNNMLIDLGDLLKKQNPDLSDTSKSLIKKIWIDDKYNRKYEINSKFLDKGIEVEEDSITLLTEHSGELFIKNKDRKTNDYLTGECDLKNKNKVIDIKSAWNIFTFSNAKVNDMNYWQIQAYMDLWKKDKGEVVYCLIDTPEHLIQDEFRRMEWKLGLYGEDLSESHQMHLDNLKAESARNMIFTQSYWDVIHSAYFPLADNSFIPIPDEVRIKRFEVDRNQKDIELAYKRIELGREYYKTIKL